MLGLFLIILGLAFLLRNLGVLSGGVWSVIWPAFLIVVGAWALLKASRRRGGFYWEERVGWRKRDDEPV